MSDETIAADHSRLHFQMALTGSGVKHIGMVSKHAIDPPLHPT